MAPGLGWAGDYPLEIMELRARPPEDLVPLLKPLAGPDGQVVGANHALFVRASPERLADIRRALAELDRPARSLLIQVRQAGHTRASGAGAGARIDEPLGGPGAGGRIRVGPPGPGGSAAALWAGEGSGSTELSHEVRALDGHPAFVATGQERPRPYREVERGPWGQSVREGIAYDRAESGFYVTSRLIGDRVILEVSTRAAVPGPGRALSTGEVQSRVEGRLGDWLPLGGGTESGSARSAGTLYGAQGRQDSGHRVEIRVLPVSD
jgi:hypothetical protein